MHEHQLSRRWFVSTAGLGVVGFALSGRSAFGGQRGAAPSPADPATIEDLVAGNRILAREQVLDAFGHISVRHPRNPDRYLLSRSLAPGLVTADDILEYD